MKRYTRILSTVVCVLALTGCAETQLMSHYAKKLPWPGQVESKGTYKVGQPYQVDRVWYYPKESFDHSETGIASWYGPGFDGKLTANGEVYDQNKLTAAHRTLQMPSLVRVTNLENGRSVVLRVNDRGPFKHGRVIDVSKRAADLLGFIGDGTARVRVDVLSEESQKLAAAAKAGQDTTRITVADLSGGKGLFNAKPKTNTTTVTAQNRTGADVNTPLQASYRSPIQLAQLKNDAEMLPESLQTPVITVEELDSPSPAYQQPPKEIDKPVWTGKQDPVASVGHVEEDGRYMPDPVVRQEPVRPTGLFVQAGSFSVYENAERLSKALDSIAKTTIEPAVVQGKQYYRVKLGPISSVAEADRVLQSVIDSGHGTARVVKN